MRLVSLAFYLFLLLPAGVAVNREAHLHGRPCFGLLFVGDPVAIQIAPRCLGTNYPGPNTTGQAYFLHILGEEEQARQQSRAALLLPDKMMSHYRSRLALAPTPPW